MPEIIHGPVLDFDSKKARVRLCTDRLTLAKRRWRGCAEDGCDFGFDLEQPLHNGEVFFESDSHSYVIAQIPELVLELPFSSASSPAELVQLGWNIGNLHFPIEIAQECLRVADDPALRRLFEREHIAFEESIRVFNPMTSSASHGHH